ncbi:MAG: polyprenyl synthetase family protein [Thermoanaerobaculia bacterium]|nr:polyprenyl synthetase family protein [Thermoanaerobaculia bacterium]
MSRSPSPTTAEDGRIETGAAAAERERVARLLAPIAGKLAATETLLRARVGSDVPFVERAGEYLFAAGGKRMRPALLLTCARLLDRDSDEEVTYAAVVELIHAATLVHDDIIDHADLRRGRRTVHAVWGSDLTVLLGDWLYTTAMRMAIAHGNLEIIDLFCAATLRMTEGELLVLERLGAPDLGLDEYFDIVDRKTAALFSAACSAPALMRPERPQAREPLAAYGRALGVCFQIADDLLDFTSSQDALGKPVLSDLREGKLTLPILLALPRLTAAERAKVEHVLADRDFRRASSDEILELVRREGTLDEALGHAERWAERARTALAQLPDGDARPTLEAAIDFVIDRRA